MCVCVGACVCGWSSEWKTYCRLSVSADVTVGTCMCEDPYHSVYSCMQLQVCVCEC